MTGEELSLHGAGRTDAGVHALGMVANYHTKATIPCPGFCKGLNSMLPMDIRVLEASEVEMNFHARIDAKAKTYWYFFNNSEIQLPTERLYAAHLRHMVRNIVGTILEVGKGKLSQNDIAAILAAKDRAAAGPTAPAAGLFLKEIFYS